MSGASPWRSTWAAPPIKALKKHASYAVRRSGSHRISYSLTGSDLGRNPYGWALRGKKNKERFQDGPFLVFKLFQRWKRPRFS